MKERRLFINEKIGASKISLIDQNGSQRGVVSREKALEEARKAFLDLVEVAYDNELSICRIMDYGKYKYEQNKKVKDRRKKQKTIQIKEVKLRPATDSHDFQFKATNARKFLEDGQKIKVVLSFRGREMAHPEIGMDVITKFAENLADFSVIERRPYSEGKRIIMTLVPLKK